MFAQTWRVQWVNNNLYLLLPGIVWVIYVMDRFIDNKVSNDERRKTSARHDFHAYHWTWFKLAIFAVGGFCLITAFQLPLAIFFHGIMILLLVVIYFFLAIFEDYKLGHPQLFKNAIAGLCFSYGVALGVFFFRPSSYWFELYFTQEALLFAVLCTCNITAIDLWEASRASNQPEEKSRYGFTLTAPLLILVILSFTLMVIGDSYARPFYLAIMISAGLLKVLNYYRGKFSLNGLRALADAALIVPVPIFWIYMQSV